MEPGAELAFAGRAALLGAVLMFSYDVIRFVRRIIPHGNIAVGVEDAFYWVYFTVAVFLMIHSGNDGRIRAFMFVGQAFGMIVYRVVMHNFCGRFFTKFKLLQKQLRNLVKLFKIGKGKE